MFKVGDKVVCIDDLGSGGNLLLGSVYTIGDVQEDYVFLEEDQEGYSWMDSRFELESELINNITPTELDPLVEIHQSEYTVLIEEVNLLQELLAEANQKLAELESVAFKPVSEYTMEDWEQALDEKWGFEQRNGNVINIIGLHYSKTTNYPVETESAWLRLSGSQHESSLSGLDIIKRIK